MRGGRALLAGAVVAAATGGCGPIDGHEGPESIAEESYAGTPPGAEVPVPRPGVTVTAAGEWVTRGETVAVVTRGSSTCQTVPVAVDVDAEAAEVTDEVSGHYQGACTADDAPFTSVLRLPEPLAADGPVTLVVEQDDEDPVTVTLE